ncbi:hypothetical protein L21SP2_1684 [Salinispira pacifica]|uniref:Uncharacterized protein n=2 Tax=Salinispira pacifica TaxID=1307761 RepID=V5WGX4_9SPIO|nr:hypothetical protein L21SP2_1684 [Salinispira pacifica]
MYIAGMNRIFHYYAVKFLALRGGIDEDNAEIIAFSSQLVDRSLIPVQVDTGAGAPYVIQPTHHFGFWDKSQEDEVWIPFHFFPSGDAVQAATRLKGKRPETPELVIPDSPPVKELLITGLKTRNPYRVGIALHSYADSWAHQNFLGRNSGINRIENFNPIPPAGHAQIGRNPDIWNLNWIDPRLKPELQIADNSRRFMAAAEKIYKYLATYSRRSFHDWELVKMELEDILFSGSSGKEPSAANTYPRPNGVAGDHRLEVEFRLKLGVDELDDALWFNEALEDLPTGSLLRRGNTDRFTAAEHEIRKLLQFRRMAPRKPRDNFQESHIYRWSEAAKAQLEDARRIIKNLC